MCGPQCRFGRGSAGPDITGGSPYIGANSIHSVIVFFSALAVDAELASLAGGVVAIIWILLRRDCHHSWRQQNQILKAAAVQRHILDVRLIDNRADGRVFGVYIHPTSNHRDLFRNGADLELEILAEIVLHVEHNASKIDRLKSFFADRDAITTRP